MIDRRAAALAAALLLVPVVGLLGADVRAAGSATVVSNGPRTTAAIALTFDDGASPENCRRIFAELVSAGVPATFFPIATAMPLDPDFWRLVAVAGYPIGNHTMTHPEMQTLGAASQLREIKDARALVESIIGRPMLNVFRPPYGAYDGTTLVEAAAAGFPTALTWDTSDRDTSQTGTLQKRLTAGEQGRNGSIVLMHCGPNATPYLLPDLINFYRDKGYRLVTVPTLLGIPWDPGATSTPAPAAILGNLAPLPPTWSGGIIVGANGYTPPPPTPTPSASAPAPTPSVSAAPTSTPSASAPAPSASVPAPASPSATVAGSPPEGGPETSGAAAPDPTVVAILVLALLAGAGFVARAAIRRRR